MRKTFWSPVVLILLATLAGCNLQNSDGSTDNKKLSIEFNHQLTSVFSQIIQPKEKNSGDTPQARSMARSDFNNVPFVVPGTTPALTANTSGPFDFSGTNQLDFEVNYDSPEGINTLSSISLNQADFVTPSSVSSAELAVAITSEFSAELATKINVIDSPLSFVGYENGSTISLAVISDNGITLSDIGFPSDNTFAKGIPDVASADYVLIGTMEITDTSSGANQTVEWNAYLDSSLFIAKSITTVLLEPGTYQFNLSLEDINNPFLRYAGETTFTVSEGNTDIPMTISPVISELSLSSSVTSQTLPSTITRYFINYPDTQLISIPTPSLGISINGGAEQLFTQGEINGAIETYLDLTAGPNTIELKLYSAGVLKGVSLEAQENQTVVAGQSIEMDIIPLSSTVEANLVESGGTLTISTNIPQEVIDEAGGEANLAGVMTLESTINGTHNAPMTIDLGFADASFIDIQFDTADITLLYTEIDTGDVVATCTVSNFDLNSDFTPPQMCDLNVRQKSLLTGNILASVGMSIVTDQGEPVNGAIVKDATTDEILGISGTAHFGTQGFVTLNLKEGSHGLTISALGSPYGDLTGNAGFTLVPLEIKNVTVPLTPVVP